MKTVYFIRHAKSSWSDPFLLDVDRPLNKRGMRDAPFMAALFKGKEMKPHLIISSHAERAYTTACYFAEILNIPKDSIAKDAGLYLCDEAYVLHTIQHLQKEVDTVCLFGHNPTMTRLANLFGTEYIANVPTCGILKVQADIEDWKIFSPSKADLVGMDYPKQYLV